MEKYIGYTIKEQISYLLCLIIMPALSVFGFVEKLYPVVVSILFLCAILYVIIEKRYIWYKYKIDNDSLIIKKLFRTQTYLFDELEKVLVSENASKPVFSFKFPKETIKVFHDKNIAQLLEYFFNNSIENIYNKKFLEFENSKRFIHITERHKNTKRDVLFIFLGSSLCFLDLYVERSKGYFIYLFLGITGLLATISLFAFILSFRRIKHSDLEYEYIDKDGFHFLNLYVPFSEITEIKKLRKRTGLSKLRLKTKDNKEWEISVIDFDGDILYEMYLDKKITRNITV
ncbi:hypothetical protein [Treponema bryantii]|uniref:hypothetical protein n=1 Tax=Treponema bryantii TaxID=163 RepID=UPI002B30A9D1|nr:hypothetical protein TRBR_02730 [Treponema bryantii]